MSDWFFQMNRFNLVLKRVCTANSVTYPPLEGLRTLARRTVARRTDARRTLARATRVRNKQ
jgi:hypothetical protein